MTNNPTIDGVSRELLERLWRGAVTMGWGSAQQLQYLLEAPAVERQATGFGMEEGGQLAEGIKSLEKIDASIDARQQRIDALNTDPEVIALQSTIAQLEDKLNKAIDLDFQRRETIAKLEREVKELESGRGVPVKLQHMAVAEDGKLRWMSGRKMQDCELYAMPDGSVIRQPLFTAPLAPVAVVLPERKPGEWRGSSTLFARGWNACLDATAALNGPAK